MVLYGGLHMQVSKSARDVAPGDRWLCMFSCASSCNSSFVRALTRQDLASQLCVRLDASCEPAGWRPAWVIPIRAGSQQPVEVSPTATTGECFRSRTLHRRFQMRPPLVSFASLLYRSRRDQTGCSKSAPPLFRDVRNTRIFSQSAPGRLVVPKYHLSIYLFARGCMLLIGGGEGKSHVGRLGDDIGDGSIKWGPLAAAALAYIAIGAWDWTDTVEALARCYSTGT